MINFEVTASLGWSPGKISFTPPFLSLFFPGHFFPPPWQIRSPVPSSGPPAPSGGCQAWLASSDLYWADLGDISAARDVHQSSSAAAVAAAMRIRKRKSVDDAAEPATPLPMCWKFQKAGEWPESVCQQQVVPGRSCSDAGIPTKPAAVCKANPSEEDVVVDKASTGDGDLAPKLQKVRGEERGLSLAPNLACMILIET